MSAQLALGQKFYDCEDVEQNYEEAFRWFCMAADQGNAEAMYYLGNMFIHGLGVVQDVGKAAEWYGKSAEKGDMDAQFQ